VTTLKSMSYLAPASLEHAPTLDEARAIVQRRLREYADDVTLPQ